MCGKQSTILYNAEKIKIENKVFIRAKKPSNTNNSTNITYVAKSFYHVSTGPKGRV